MVVAEFAVITLVDNPMKIGGSKLRDMAPMVVDPVEERGERGTEVKAPATAVADFINTQGLFFE